MSSDEVFINKLNALLSCNPAVCAKINCPLYYEEQCKCDAYRFLALFNEKMKKKLESADKYDPFDDN